MPLLGQIRPGRAVHILDGDGDGRGGGHRWDSPVPGKTLFPRDWSDDTVLERVRDVARRPDFAPRRQDNDRWVCEGVREGVCIQVVVDPDGAVRTALPLYGPGVTRNPR